MASGVGESVGTASRLTGIRNLCSNRKSLSCATAAATAKSLQLCPTLCDPVDDSPPGSAVPRIVQARTLEWVAISLSNAYMHAKLLQSCPTLDPVDCSPPGSSVHGIFQQEYWSGVPLPSLDLEYTESKTLSEILLSVLSGVYPERNSWHIW